MAVASALEECDHARLPAWMVAQIAVESMRSSLRGSAVLASTP